MPLGTLRFTAFPWRRSCKCDRRQSHRASPRIRRDRPAGRRHRGHGDPAQRVSMIEITIVNQGSEFVRFSGVVNPTTITAGNIVSSTKVADARIEYKGNGYLDETQTMGWLARFFLTVLPF